MMYRFEILIDHDRLQRRLDTIRTRFHVREIAKSFFWCVYGCSLDSPLTDEEKTWLSALIDAKVIVRYRCKIRDER